MEIILNAFRCHSKSRYIWNSNGIHLISGRSGTGKSTILEAVYWCLYKKILKVTPIGSKKVRTSVTLSLPNLQVYRQNNPSIIRVTTPDGSIHEGQPAELIIVQTFGDPSFWIATSYLRQDASHVLTSGSSEDKLNLINYLTFSNETPGDYISKVDTSLKETTTNRNNTSAVFDVRLKQLLENMNRNGISNEDMSSSPKIVFLDKELSLEEAEKAVQDYDLQLYDVRRYQKELDLMLSKESNLLRDIGEYTSESIEAELQSISEHRDYFTRKHEYESRKRYYESLQRDRECLSRKVQVLFSQLPPDLSVKINNKPLDRKHEFTSRDIAAVETLLRNIETYSEEARRYGIEYTSEALANEISRLKFDLDRYTLEVKNVEILSEIRQMTESRTKMETTRLEKETELSQLQSSRPNTPQSTPPSTQDLDILSNSIRELEIRRRSFMNKTEREITLESLLAVPVMNCPHCEGHVRYTSKGLVKIADYSPSEYSKELKDIALQKEASLKELDDSLFILRNKQRENEATKTAFEAFKRNCDNIESQIRWYDLEIEKLMSRIEMVRKRVSNSSIELNVSELTNSISRIHNALNYVSRIVYIEPYTGITPEEMRTHNIYLDYLREKNALDSLEKNIADAIRPTVIPELDGSPRKYPDVASLDRSKRMLENKRLDLGKLSNLEENIRDLKMRYESLPKEENLLSWRKALSDNINRYKTITVLLRDRDELIPLSDTLRDYEEKALALAKLRQTMVDAEYASYVNTVNMINEYLSRIIKPLFFDPIDVRISMFKTVKTKNRITPKVNLIILSQGEEIEYSQMSGGEKKRISLGLTLALSHFSDSPILLLDEILGPLKDDDTEIVLPVLESHGRNSGRITLCVNHGGSTGWYDSETDLDPK